MSKELVVYYPQGIIFYRFIGKDIFIKIADQNLQLKADTIQKLRLGGADVLESRGWLKVNMFHTHKIIKLGDYDIDSEEEKPEEIEIKMVQFYSDLYKEFNTKFELKDLKK